MTINIQADNGKIIQTDTPITQQSTDETLPFNQVRISDNRIVTLRRAKGRDLRNAERLIQSESSIERGFALASIVSSVEGKPFNYEEFLDLDLLDCNKIVTRYGELMGNSLSPAQPT